jgi:hypothetical protein
MSLLNVRHGATRAQAAQIFTVTVPLIAGVLGAWAWMDRPDRVILFGLVALGLIVGSISVASP